MSQSTPSQAPPVARKYDDANMRDWFDGISGLDYIFALSKFFFVTWQWATVIAEFVEQQWFHQATAFFFYFFFIFRLHIWVTSKPPTPAASVPLTQSLSHQISGHSVRGPLVSMVTAGFNYYCRSRRWNSGLRKSKGQIHSGWPSADAVVQYVSYKTLFINISKKKKNRIVFE